jgi:type I restriction enzyme M protein
VALKKSDLYSSIWQSCDELRGGMDASQYKDYILTLLFVKYVTDKAKSDPNSLIDVPEAGSFDDMVKLKGDAEIGDKINKLIGRLAEANDLQKVIDLADFNDEEKLGKGKEMVDRLSKLVAIFEDIDFKGSRAEGDDLLGDAYEYLMQKFATESGKSKGQFYTPAEVSRVLAKVVGIGPQTRQDQTVYDPACGSGSLLLKAADEAPRGITIYGQEKDVATWSLARMNMILHSHETADIRRGDTITDPQFVDGPELKRFDFAVMNPPFSLKSWSNGLEHEFGRFQFGRPPEKIGDYAFLLHVLTSLKGEGKAAVIMPHGVLFRGGAEAGIRRELIKRGYIKGIIGLPINLFYGTGIPACIVVLDKANAQARTGIFMVDASKGLIKDGAKNRLRSQDIHKIVDVFNRQVEVERYSRMVPVAEIAADGNDYNLNIARYIDAAEPEDLQDLRAHVHGGIPSGDADALEDFWKAFPTLRESLFRSRGDGYLDLAVDVSEVEATVLDSTEVKQVADAAHSVVADWFESHRELLLSIDAHTRPKELVETLGDDLLSRFAEVPLVDEYDAYEQLLSYWHETMHDDVFLVMHDGWLEAARPRPARVLGKDKNGKPKYEEAHLKIGSGKSAERYVMDLLPPEVIVREFLADKKAALSELEAKSEEAMETLNDYVAEYAIEDGPCWEAVDDTGKVTQKSVNAATREAKANRDDDAVVSLEELARLLKAQAAAKKAEKDAATALDLAALNKYGDLTEDEVKALVLGEKWKRTLAVRIDAEVTALVLGLAARVHELGERYRETIGDIEQELAGLDDRVNAHLVALGAA